MDKAPLVMDDIEAGKAFLERMNDYAPVKAACWLRWDDEGARYLHVALDGLTVANLDLAYREVLRISQELKDHYIDPFRVKVISPDDPVARAVMDVYRRFPGRKPPRFDGTIFGGSAAAEVYIYPPLPAKP
jgi:hypothetical protein